jgi:DNA-binding transcriptional MerR regulator
MTIEELAAKSGITVRNIRSHRARGLLPAPEVRERVGYYGRSHLERLRVIRELQAEGLNLQGIKLLLDQAGDSSGRLLDLKATLARPFETEQPRVFTVEELAERFGGAVDPAILRQAESFGTLVPLGEGRWEAPAPSLIEIAAEVASQGVPLEHALAVGRKVNDRCEAIARDFVRLYLDDLWKPFADAGYPAERWDQIVDSIERLRPLSSRAVLAAYQLTMSREVEAAFGQELRRRAKGKR